jgi:conserved hypothetical protein, YfiH family
MENIIYRNNEGIEYIQFKRLLEYPEVTHCYTMRSNNQLNFQIKNRDFFNQSCDKIYKCLELKNPLVVRPYQTHTDNVKIVKKIEKLEDTDGIITNKKEIALITTSADCISLLLYDPVKKAIGSIHSGWKGTLKRIIIKAIEKMITEYHSKPEDIICCICPSIRQCCFEVDEDVKDLFYNKYKNLKNIDEIIKLGDKKENKQKYYIDTVKINIELLKNIGLKEENIIDSNICTMCHSKEFHSYRADEKSFGVNGAIIAIK